MIKKMLFLVLLLSSSLYANTKSYQIAKENSKISFSIVYMLMTDVVGNFKDFSGTFETNTAGTEIKNINVNVKSITVDSSDDRRDFHLRGHEFFFSTKFPDIKFVSSNPIALKVGEKIVVPGQLTLRGVKKPLTLFGIFKGKTKDIQGNENLVFDLSGELNRKDFGITWNKAMDSGGLLIDDKVKINIVVVAKEIKN